MHSINSALIPIPVAPQQGVSTPPQNHDRPQEKAQPEKVVVPASVVESVLDQLNKRTVTVIGEADEAIDGLGFRSRKALSAYSAQQVDMERDEISRILGVDEHV